MATVTSFTASRMQEILDSGVVSGAIVNGELVLTRYDGSTFTLGDITSEIGGSNVIALRSFHRWLGQADVQTVDIVICGDSISEGWFGDGAEDNTFINRFRKLAASRWNAKNFGSYGRYVPGGSGWFNKPRFSINGSGCTEGLNCLALRSRFMANNSPEAVLPETIMDGISVYWYKANVYGYANGYIRVMALKGQTTTLQGGATIDLATNPTTITVDSTSNLSSSGYVVITKASDGQQAIIQYTGTTQNTLTGCTMRSELTFPVNSVIEQAEVAVSTEVTGFNVNLGAYVRDLQEWYSGVLPRGRYVVGIAQKSIPGGNNGGWVLGGIYAYDGDRSIGLRVFNGSHSGATFNTYVLNDTDSYGNGWASFVSKNCVIPKLWIWTLGVNETAIPSVFETQMRAAIQAVWDAQDAASQMRCAQALVVPYVTATKTSSEWQEMINVYYKVAMDLNLAVWDWSEFIGPINIENGDPLGWSNDGIHMYSPGQRAVGDWLNDQVFNGAPGPGLSDSMNRLYSVEYKQLNRKIANYTLALTDQNTLVDMNVGSANTLTVPPNSSVAFPIGTVIECSQYGAGLTTVVAGSGVTIYSRGNLMASAGQYSRFSLKKVDVDEWYLYGDLA